MLGSRSKVGLNTEWAPQSEFPDGQFGISGWPRSHRTFAPPWQCMTPPSFLTAHMAKSGGSSHTPARGLESIKIVGTNSTTSLESVKASKNELKTNSKRTQICAKNSAFGTQNAGWCARAGAFCRHVCAPLPHRTADMPKTGWSASSATEGFEKDVKIVGTNSTTSLESVTASKSELKTNSNRAQNLAKNRLLAPET